MTKTIYNKLKKNVCKILCDEKDGTGFLVSDNLILTAYHVIEESDELKVVFDTKNALDVTIEYSDEKLDIAILKLENKINFYEDIPISDVQINHNEKWISRGFPSFNSEIGENILEHIDCTVGTPDHLHNKNNVHLEIKQKLDTFIGFSGAPLVINEVIVGIIKDEKLQKGTARELKALSVKYYKNSLEKLGINVSSLLVESNKLGELLTFLPFNDYFVGRNNDLIAIHQKLLENPRVSLFGMGGIGKTSLLIEYVKKFQYNYDNLAFIEYNRNIKNSLIEAFKFKIDYKSKNEDERILQIQKFILSLKGNSIIIIDNLQTIGDYEYLKNTLSISQFKILVSSRFNINSTTRHELSHLNYDDSKTLFFKYHNTKENIDNILNYLGYHPLFIELTAKTLESSSILSIKDLETKFKLGNFLTIYNNSTNKEFNQYLNELFEIKDIDKDTLLILKKFALFPSIEIDFAILKEIFDIKDIDITYFDSQINNLSNRGWLIKKNNRFKLHEIIKEYLIQNHKIEIPNAVPIIITIYDKMTIRNIFLREDLDKKRYYVSFATSIIKYFQEKTPLHSEILFNLVHSTSYLYQHCGEYNLALEYIIKALDMYSQSNNTDKGNLINLYNNISVIYRYLEKIDDAYDYLNFAFKMQEEQFHDQNHIEIARTYNNLATLHMQKFDYANAYGALTKAIEIKLVLNEKYDLEMALYYTNLSLVCLNLSKEQDKNKKAYMDDSYKYQKDAIKIQEDLAPESSALSFSYNNLSLCYVEDNLFITALEYQQLSLNIKEKNFAFILPEIALGYGNLALIYSRLKRLDIALEIQIYALEIRKKIFSYPHTEIANSYHEISFIYYLLKNFEAALKNQLESLKIYKMSLGNEYYDIYDSYYFISLIYYSMKKPNLKKAIEYKNKSILALKKSPFFNTLELLRFEYELAKLYKENNDIKLFGKLVAKLEHKVQKIKNCPDNIYQKIKSLSQQ